MYHEVEHHIYILYLSGKMFTLNALCVSYHLPFPLYPIIHFSSLPSLVLFNIIFSL
jgi:hypothetical protein